MSSELSPLHVRGAPFSSKSNVTLAYCIHSRAMRATRSCALRDPEMKQTLMVSPRRHVSERTTTPRTWPSEGPLSSAGISRVCARAAGSVAAMQEGCSKPTSCAIAPAAMASIAGTAHVRQLQNA